MRPPKTEVQESATAKLIVAMKEALGDKVKDVRSSKRLTDSAVCLVADGELDRTLEKLLSRQKDSGVNVSAPVLEINAGHPLIVALAAAADSGGFFAEIADAAQLLLDQAHVLEGEPVERSRRFCTAHGECVDEGFRQVMCLPCNSAQYFQKNSFQIRHCRV